MKEFAKKIFMNNTMEKFSEISFEEMSPRIKHMNLVDFAGGVIIKFLEISPTSFRFPYSSKQKKFEKTQKKKIKLKK